MGCSAFGSTDEDNTKEGEGRAGSSWRGPMPAEGIAARGE
jgi:hypothetical protein